MNDLIFSDYACDIIDAILDERADDETLTLTEFSHIITLITKKLVYGRYTDEQVLAAARVAIDKVIDLDEDD